MDALLKISEFIALIGAFMGLLRYAYAIVINEDKSEAPFIFRLGVGLFIIGCVLIIAIIFMTNLN